MHRIGREMGTWVRDAREPMDMLMEAEGVVDALEDIPIDRAVSGS